MAGAVLGRLSPAATAFLHNGTTIGILLRALSLEASQAPRGASPRLNTSHDAAMIGRTSGLAAFESSATDLPPGVGAIVRQVVAVHALLTSESDISPRNEKINRALGDLVKLLLRPYDPCETAAVLDNAEIVALKDSLLARLSEAEFALERFWSEHFLGRTSLGLCDLEGFIYWRYYERLLGMEMRALSHLRQRHREFVKSEERIAFVGGGPLPLSAILLHAKTGASVVCIDSDAVAFDSAKRLMSMLGFRGATAVHADGADFDYQGFSTIVIASLVAKKAAVVRRIVETSKHALVAVRTVEGMRTLLYSAADVVALQAAGLELAGHTSPDAETINATLFFQGDASC
jgi:hypothetical protein